MLKEKLREEFALRTEDHLVREELLAANELGGAISPSDGNRACSKCGTPAGIDRRIWLAFFPLMDSCVRLWC
jgi:ribosomal protein S14